MPTEIKVPLFNARPDGSMPGGRDEVAEDFMDRVDAQAGYSAPVDPLLARRDALLARRSSGQDQINRDALLAERRTRLAAHPRLSQIDAEIAKLQAERGRLLMEAGPGPAAAGSPQQSSLTERLDKVAAGLKPSRTKAD